MNLLKEYILDLLKFFNKDNIATNPVINNIGSFIKENKLEQLSKTLIEYENLDYKKTSDYLNLSRKLELFKIQFEDCLNKNLQDDYDDYDIAMSNHKNLFLIRFDKIKQLKLTQPTFKFSREELKEIDEQFLLSFVDIKNDFININVNKCDTLLENAVNVLITIYVPYINQYIDKIDNRT